MLDVLNRETTDELPLDTMTKAERVEHELRTNSARSDREIGRVCGVDGKTVSKARERLGIKKTREDLICDAAPHIDWDSPAVHDSLGRIKVRDAAAETLLGVDDDEDEEGTYWPIPSQARIECRKAEKGDVHIWQEGAGPQKT